MALTKVNSVKSFHSFLDFWSFFNLEIKLISMQKRFRQKFVQNQLTMIMQKLPNHNSHLIKPTFTV